MTTPALADDKTLLEPDGTMATPVHRIPLYDAEGSKISLDDDPVMPFSTRQTCGKCHDYEKIRTGMHFNMLASKAPAGRAGEPWILYGPKTGTQIPLSSRNRPGTFNLESLGIGPFRFVRVFGRHMTGGGPGEAVDPKEAGARWLVTGKFEINCMACHNADASQDQNEAAIQLGQQNFMWAASAACGLAVVQGSAAAVPDSYDPFMESDEGGKGPKVLYDKTRFDAEGRVLFNVVRDIPNTRCLFCHTTKPVGPGAPKRWQRDGDVHIAAGMKCVDCHRNGLDHKMNRGYPGEPIPATQPAAETLTCRGCHMGEDAKTGRKVLGGRFAAPFPEHRGLPAVHIDKLTCTACHSGPMPQQTVGRVQTSRSHRLGIHGKYRGEDSPPYIVGPVYIRMADGRIGPHNLMYPALWGRLVRDPGSPDKRRIMPIGPGKILDVAGSVLNRTVPTTQSSTGAYWPLTNKQVSAVGKVLGDDKTAGPVVYVTGGKVYAPDPKGLSPQGAEPYAWPVTHDVRPARQALGTESCQQCHSEESNFFFGRVLVHSLANMEKYSSHDPPMSDFMDVKGSAATFCGTFSFRPYLKIVLWIAAGLIAAVVLVYGLKGLRATCGRFSREGNH